MASDTAPEETLMAIRPLSDRELFLLTTPDDTEDSPWMVMSSSQSEAIWRLYSILLRFVEQQRLPWYVVCFLKLVLPRPGSRRPLEVAPDLLVGLAPAHPRDSWRLAEEGKVPEFVLEVASRWSWERDSEDKPEIYESAGVQEYALFWPRRDDGGPRLFGYRRGAEERFERWERDAAGVLWSAVLGLGLYVEDEVWLRAMTPDGQPLPTPREAEAAEAVARQAEAYARHEAEQAREVEAQARAEAERELQRLREELRCLRGDA